MIEMTGRLTMTPEQIEAFGWLSEAQGLGTATMNLGYCYLRGHGVPADKAEALRLFRLAVERGEQRAADELERLGERVQVRNDLPRRAWEKDDCFGLPEPGSPEDRQIKQGLHLPPVPTPLEESYFGIYASEVLRPTRWRARNQSRSAEP